MKDKVNRNFLSHQRKRMRQLLSALESLCFKTCSSELLFHGTAIESFRRCGKAGCKCARGGDYRHGPYKSIHTIVDGKQKHISLKKSEMRYFDMVQRYQQAKQDRAEIVDLSMRLLEIIDELIERRTIWDKRRSD